MNSALPLVITQGDASGIGPEIIAKLFRNSEASGCFVIGDVGVLRRAATLTGGMLAVARIERPADALEAPPQCIPVLQADELPADLLRAPLGQVDARAGAAAAACIRQAAALAMAGEVAGIVTAPIHKEALAAAGVGFPGHTEMLQSLAAVDGRVPAVRLGPKYVRLHPTVVAEIQVRGLDGALGSTYSQRRDRRRASPHPKAARAHSGGAG